MAARGLEAEGGIGDILSKRKKRRPPIRRPPLGDIDYVVVFPISASVSPVRETAAAIAGGISPFLS